MFISTDATRADSSIPRLYGSEPGVRLRRLAAALVAAVLGLLVPGIALAPAAHAEAYRYWGYYHWENGQWAFAQTGPDGYTPKDGAVEGWRFAVSDETTTKFPRTTGDFEQICGATEAETGKKRVALVIDYGNPEDAPDGAAPPEPRGACVVVDSNTNGAQVLTAVASARVENGLMCGIDDYPATGCGDAVASPPPPGSEEPVQLALPESADPAQTPASGSGDSAADGENQATGASEDGDSSLPTGLLVGIGAVAVIGVGAVLMARRSRES